LGAFLYWSEEEEHDAAEELTVHECNVYAGRSLRDSSVRPIRMILTLDIVTMLELGDSDFWHAVIAIIDDDIRAGL
jgi:hypothetical protein